LLFLDREVINVDVTGTDASHTERPQYVPAVMTKEERRRGGEEEIAVIQQCDCIHQLVLKLLYGSGLHLIEGLQVKDGMQSPLDP
jgi:hypothetical protein